MTVPRYNGFRSVLSGEERTVFPFRPNFLRIGSVFCGTAIAVPYIGCCESFSLRVRKRKGTAAFCSSPFQTVKEPMF